MTLPENTLIEDGALRVCTDDVTFEVKPQSDADGVEITLIVWGEKFSDPDRTHTFEITDAEWDAATAHVNARRLHKSEIALTLRLAHNVGEAVVIECTNGVEVQAGHITALADTVWLWHPDGTSSNIAVRNIASVLPADPALDPATMKPYRRQAVLRVLADHGWVSDDGVTFRPNDFLSRLARRIARRTA